ncbi:MAG: FHA domain-containing protein [Planctomycetota bacterium]|nr:MAG: FHA domain-containing protein [Planctomycetota bacterium]
MYVEVTTDRGRRYAVRMGQRLTVGRGSAASIRVLADRVSRLHAALELTPEGLWVTDLGSRNGTFLSNARLAPHQPVRACARDTVRIGGCALELRTLEEDEVAARSRARTRRLDEPLLPRDEFEVLGEIGRGATGRVYAARERRSGLEVAIKVLHNEFAPDLQERFVREGEAMVRIRSPYVVRLYHVRRLAKRLFLVMERVNGVSAKDRLCGGPFPVPEALKVCEDAARGLHAAHQAKVIHRDVKPANLLITAEGRAKLADFGIAKVVDSLESLTKTGEGLGTLAYVSPEQAQEAKGVSPQTDLYSLGATLYHLLSGRPPIVPKSLKSFFALLEGPLPSVRSLVPELPPAVVYLVHHLLEKDPAHRPPDAAAVAEELRRLREEHYPDFGAVLDQSSADEETLLPPEDLSRARER